APIYAFFGADPEIEFANDGTAEYLVYSCTNCGEKKKQGLKTQDKGSTGNMSNHAKKCWGEEAVAAAKDSTLDKARDAIKKIGKKSQSKLTAALKTLTARWVAESARPFRMVRDRCYRWLQKEGRPNHYVPSKETVARDVKKLFLKTKEKLAEELQAFDGEIPVAVDCWTSPNHHAFMSIETTWLRRMKDGTEELTTTLLDFVELPCSHSAENMAEALDKTFKEYGIDGKVSKNYF
ncbi:hypothetical protein BT96DRAFT_816998, partial [Gymnopus androsaceus JB14]